VSPDVRTSHAVVYAIFWPPIFALPVMPGPAFHRMLVGLHLDHRLQCRQVTPPKLRAVLLLPFRRSVLAVFAAGKPVERDGRVLDVLFEQQADLDLLAVAVALLLELDDTADVDPVLPRLGQLEAVLPFDRFPLSRFLARLFVFRNELGPPERIDAVAERDVVVPQPVFVVLAIDDRESPPFDLPFALLDARRVNRSRLDRVDPGGEQQQSRYGERAVEPLICLPFAMNESMGAALPHEGLATLATNIDGR